MYDVKQYAFTVFCCSLAISIVEFITPVSCKKQISYITGMIMLTVVISPLTSLPYYIPPDIIKQNVRTTSEVDTNDILEEQFKYNLSQIIQDKLLSSGIFAEDIGIEIIMSDNEIALGGINVTLNDHDFEKCSEIKQMLEKLLEVEVAVDTVGGEKYDG